MEKMLKKMNPCRALCAVGEWVSFWWMSILSMPEWAAEEREIRAEEEEELARSARRFGREA